MIEIYSDGSHSASIDLAKPQLTKSAIVIYKDKKLIISESKLHGPGWSDVAEYEGILHGLKKLIELKLNTQSIHWFCDNQFVVNFMRTKRVGKSKKDYYKLAVECVDLLKEFIDIQFHWIPRENNKEADLLSKI